MGEKQFQSAKSRAGEQFLPLDFRAEVYLKGVFIQAPVWHDMTWYDMTWHDMVSFMYGFSEVYKDLMIVQLHGLHFTILLETCSCLVCFNLNYEV